MVDKKRYIPAGLVAVIGVALSYATFKGVERLDLLGAEDAFQRTAVERTTAVETSIHTELTILKSIVGFFQGSNYVDRNEFRTFLSSILSETQTSFQALEWVPRVPHAKRAQFESQARGDGHVDFQIRERTLDGEMVSAYQRDEYFPVFYVEPYQGNELALGFDLGSNPLRRQTLEEARDSGQVTASGEIQLVQHERNIPAILLFAPIYVTGKPHDTLEQRRENLEGFALGVVEIPNMISGLRNKTGHQHMGKQEDLDLYIYDTRASHDQQLLYVYNSSHRTAPAPALSWDQAHVGLHHDHSIVVGGRPWSIVARPASDQATLSPQAVLAAFLTLTITMMLTGYLISTVRRAQRIENLVEQRTGELKKASLEAQDREERIRIVLETVVDAIVTIDEYGVIETFNPAAEHIFGYRAEEVIGQNVKCLMPDPYRSEHDGYLQNYRTYGKGNIIGVGRELPGQRKDGSTFPLELAISEMSLGGKRMFTGVVRDITERKENERLKQEFISTVSHELRTPLTSIKGSLGLIKSGVVGDLPEKLLSMLDIAHTNSDRLVHLINDILDMEKITAGKMDFHMAPINIRTLLTQAIAANQSYGEKYNVDFVLGACPDAGLVRGDRHRLMQVMANLLSNGAKFSPPEKAVEVSAHHIDNGYRIEIRDHGPGIPEEFHDQIFKRFSQADSADTRQKGGTGLGLSISQAIIEHHLGKIGFEKGVEDGSIFYFELPEWSHTSEIQSQPEEQASPRHGRILVCEDEPDIAALLTMMLEKDHYTAHVAHTAMEARALLDEYTFDAMTLDIALPDEDGLSLIRELRENPSTRMLPIIVVSAHAADGAKRLNGDGFGVIDWLEKPIDQNRLSDGLHRAVQFSRSGRPRILHLEDDPDVLEIVSHLAADVGTVVPATTLDEARNLIQSELFDLVILDLMLPDGDGESILPLLKRPNGTSTPVIVFSAREVSASAVQSISAALIKSQTSNQDLLDIIKAAMASTMADHVG